MPNFKENCLSQNCLTSRKSAYVKVKYQKVPIFKYYTSQGCLAQGFTVVGKAFLIHSFTTREMRMRWLFDTASTSSQKLLLYKMHTLPNFFLLFSFPFPFSISVLDVVKNRRNSPRWSMPRLRWKRCDTLSLSWFQRQPILDLWPPGNYLFNYLGEIKNSLWSVVFHWMFKSRPSRTESSQGWVDVSRFLCPLGGQKKAFDHPMELNLGTE